MAPNYLLKQIKRVSAGSRNSSETVYTAEKVLQDVITRRSKPQRDASISDKVLLRICDPQ
jgi:hypothetical protein